MSQDLFTTYEKEPAYSWQSRHVILAGCPLCGETHEVLAPKKGKEGYTLKLEAWHYRCPDCRAPLE